MPVPGFARRENRGDDLFGARYMSTEFKAHANKLIEKGNKESSAKKQPGQILDSIKANFQKRFSFPTEYEVRVYVGSVLQKGKEQNNEDNHENHHEKEQTSTTSSTSAEDKQHFEENMKKITEWLNNSLPKSGNITKFPKDFFTEMRDKFPDLQPWFMTWGKDVKKRISTIKQKVKGNARKQIF